MGNAISLLHDCRDSRVARIFFYFGALFLLRRVFRSSFIGPILHALYYIPLFPLKRLILLLANKYWYKRKFFERQVLIFEPSKPFPQVPFSPSAVTPHTTLPELEGNVPSAEASQELRVKASPISSSSSNGVEYEVHYSWREQLVIDILREATHYSSPGHLHELFHYVTAFVNFFYKSSIQTHTIKFDSKIYNKSGCGVLYPPRHSFEYERLGKLYESKDAAAIIGVLEGGSPASTASKTFVEYVCSNPDSILKDLELPANELVRKAIAAPLVKPFNTFKSFFVGDADLDEKCSVVIHFHGGGYVVGRALQYCGAYSELTEAGARGRVPLRVFAPEYSVALNGAFFPIAIQQALLAYDYVLAQGIPSHHIIFSGDSAGGGLALITALLCRDTCRRLPAGLALISPWVDLRGHGQNAKPEQLKSDWIHMHALSQFVDYYLHGLTADIALVSPVLTPSFKGLPPTLCTFGGRELFLNQDHQLTLAMRRDGVAVTAVCDTVMTHIYPFMGELFGASAKNGFQFYSDWIVKTLAAARKPQTDESLTRNRFSSTNFS